MNEFVPDPLVTKLRALYQSDENARHLLDHFAKRQNKANFTTAEAVETVSGAFRGDAVDLLKRLSDFGLGTYYIGRRGAQTRIEWDYDIREVGKAAQGQVKSLTADNVDDESDFSEVGTEELATEDFADVEFWDHSFPLRSNFRLMLRLPADLTLREAERIGAWVRSLPVES